MAPGGRFNKADAKTEGRGHDIAWDRSRGGECLCFRKLSEREHERGFSVPSLPMPDIEKAMLSRGGPRGEKQGRIVLRVK